MGLVQVHSGTSGRVVTIPLQGILTYGTHTGYDTSGTISSSVLFHHDVGSDWMGCFDTG